MVDERRRRRVLERGEQYGECRHGVIGRIPVRQPLPRLTGIGGVTPLQGVEHIVAEHDITAIGEQVELHRGRRQKSWSFRSARLAHFTALLKVRPLSSTDSMIAG
jgi:hypothetical protein